MMSRRTLIRQMVGAGMVAVPAVGATPPADGAAVFDERHLAGNLRDIGTWVLDHHGAIERPGSADGPLGDDDGICVVDGWILPEAMVRQAVRLALGEGV